MADTSSQRRPKAHAAEALELETNVVAATGQQQHVLHRRAVAVRDLCHPDRMTSDVHFDGTASLHGPDGGEASERRPARREPSGPAIAACVRRFCLDCLGATSGRAAFDCGSQACPLRPASPFLGKPMPKTFRVSADAPEPAPILRRRPSRRLIEAQCRQCQPEDRSDCGATNCGLYPYRPWPGPGRAERRKASPALAAALARARQKPAQKGSTVVGAASDG